MKPPLRRSDDHAWQSGRWIDALDTGHFVPDERSFAELASRATAYARLLTYYDDRNQAHPPPGPGAAKEVGAWESFFRDDVTFLLAEMAAVDAPDEFAARLAEDRGLYRQISAAGLRLMRWSERAEHLAARATPYGIETALFEAMQRISQGGLSGLIPPSVADEVAHWSGKLPAQWCAPTEGTTGAEVFSSLNRITGQLCAEARLLLPRSLAEKHDHPPHTGLYLAFLGLLEKSQVDLNRMTERHLRFHLHDVLKLWPAPAVPDCVHLTFRLAPGARPCTLFGGTDLVAGSSAVPGTPVFRTVADLTVTAAAVRAFKALSLRRTPDGTGVLSVAAVSAWPKADSADGAGMPFVEPERGWLPFGPDAASASAQAPIGIAVAAPILALAGGRREIILTMHFRTSDTVSISGAVQAYRTAIAATYAGGAPGPARMAAHLSRVFAVGVSTAQGVNPVDDVRLETGEVDQGRMILRITVPPEAPPVTAMQGDEPWPMLVIRLNPAARVFGYAAFRAVELASVDVAVQVTGLRDLVLAGPQGPIDPKKPFAPFGPLPLPGCALDVTSSELRQAGLESLGLTLDWTGLPRPPQDFTAHYAGYLPEITNESFTISVARSDGEIWSKLPAIGVAAADAPRDLQLFMLAGDGAGIPSRSVIGIEVNPTLSVPRDEGRAAARTLGAGALRIELTGPLAGFGQRAYPALVAGVALANARQVPRLPFGLSAAPTPAPLPQEPVLPLVEGFAVDYRARLLPSDDPAAPSVRLFHVHPLGRMTPATNGRLFAEEMDFDGRLMIGLSGVDPPDTLTLFFDLEDSTADLWARGDGFARPAWRWSCLAAEGWRVLPDAAILADETNGLTAHGIIRIALPRDLAASADLSDVPLFWIAITVSGDLRRYGRIRSVTAQAVAAVRVIEGDGTVLSQNLPADSVQRMLTARPEIAAIAQPLPSQGGRPPEDEKAFRIRVSERLRHKDRAIQPADCVRMVLQAFPQVGDARCLRDPCGHPTLVVMARRGPETARRAALVPLTLRFEIARWLRARASEWANGLTVRNPSRETIRVSARIVGAGQETSDLIHDIRAAVDRIIAPWMFDPDAPVMIGDGFLDLAEVGARLQMLPGVRKIAGLSLLHRFAVHSGFDGHLRHGLKDTARARRGHAGRERDGDAILRHALPWSIFVPSDAHDIAFQDAREGIGHLAVDRDFAVTPPELVRTYLDDGSLIPQRPRRAGIGNLRVSAELVITSEADAVPSATLLDQPGLALDRIFLENAGLDPA